AALPSCSCWSQAARCGCTWRSAALTNPTCKPPERSPQMKRKLVVIGAGMASGRMLEQLFEAAPDAFDVTLFNAEPRGNYNRLMLSPVLSGEKTYEEIITHGPDWYEAHGVDCRFGQPVVHIDREARVVHSN